MIRYTLKCKCGVKFEGQFPDLKSFTKQKKKGMIQCPYCDGINLTFSKINSKRQPSNGKITSTRLT